MVRSGKVEREVSQVHLKCQNSYMVQKFSLLTVFGIENSPLHCLPLAALCIECSLFSRFFLSGTVQAFEIGKSPRESKQAGSNPFLCVCVFVRSGQEGSGWPLLLSEGTSRSHVLPFCTHSWRTDSARHPPASLTLLNGINGTRDSIIGRLFFNGVQWAGVHLSSCCLLSRCLPGTLSCSPHTCCDHVYQPELSTESEQCLCNVCASRKSVLLESPAVAYKRSLPDLPLNY